MCDWNLQGWVAFHCVCVNLYHLAELLQTFDIFWLVLIWSLMRKISAKKDSSHGRMCKLSYCCANFSCQQYKTNKILGPHILVYRILPAWQLSYRSPSISTASFPSMTSRRNCHDLKADAIKTFCRWIILIMRHYCQFLDAGLYLLIIFTSYSITLSNLAGCFLCILISVKQCFDSWSRCRLTFTLKWWLLFFLVCLLLAPQHTLPVANRTFAALFFFNWGCAIPALMVRVNPGHGTMLWAKKPRNH